MRKKHCVHLVITSRVPSAGAPGAAGRRIQPSFGWGCVLRIIFLEYMSRQHSHGSTYLMSEHLMSGYNGRPASHESYFTWMQTGVVCGTDLDDVCAFKTPKMVIIRDWKLGFFHRVCTSAIAFYVGIFVLYLDRGYLSQVRYHCNSTTFFL
jgi:hypothetical protein